jgi:hypothetical protein
MGTDQTDEFFELKKKAQIYFSKFTFICVTLTDGKFYHGNILELSDLFIMFKDRYLSEPIPIFFNEINKIEPSLQKRGGYGSV